VNLLVDCADQICAAVEFESNPTPQHMFGRIEKEAVFGAAADFTMSVQVVAPGQRRLPGLDLMSFCSTRSPGTS
jgi:hypothetical protein